MTNLNRVIVAEPPPWAREPGRRQDDHPRLVLKQLRDRVLVYCAVDRAEAVLARWAWKEGDFTTYPPRVLGPFREASC